MPGGSTELGNYSSRLRIFSIGGHSRYQISGYASDENNNLILSLVYYVHPYCRVVTGLINFSNQFIKILSSIKSSIFKQKHAFFFLLARILQSSEKRHHTLVPSAYKLSQSCIIDVLLACKKKLYTGKLVLNSNC
jgi:hypothetical protein